MTDFAPKPGATLNGPGSIEELKRHDCREDGEYSWWENDAQGIPLCRVCAKCRQAKLSGYRPEILTGYDQSDVDEPIELEDYQGCV